MNFATFSGFGENRPGRGRRSRRPVYSRQKNGTSAETYGEPQTPVNRFAVALQSEPEEFSTAANSGKRVILAFGASL
jgi:hypothetical protein